MEERKIGIYPGTFDPLTNGHISIIKRATKIFDTVIVAVADETNKNTLFNLNERLAIVKETFQDRNKIEVQAFSGLLVDFAAKNKVQAIIRGLRAVSDFEYEFQLALMNRRLKPEIQTMFLMADYRWLYVSSTIVKAAASLAGDVKGLVPSSALNAMRSKYGHPETWCNSL